MTIPSILLRWLLPIGIGVLAGLGSAWWATGEATMEPLPGHPEWRSDTTAGSTHADVYTRARIARTGLLALNRDETIYYFAATDHDGKPLTETCTYEITGKPLPGQWWALTLYANDMFLARNDDDANNVGSSDMVAAPDGSWTVRVAATREGAANWLSTRNSSAFLVNIRLYQPDKAVQEGKVPELPVIHRIACAAQSSS